MIRELERVDPSTMQHEEKLAFWLNIYNALMMHVSYKLDSCSFFVFFLYMVSIKKIENVLGRPI